MKFSKNDYKIYKDLKDFANKNTIGRFLRPPLKYLYKIIYPFLPQPRNFLLRNISKNGVCCEIGVWEGDFSERIMRICKPKKLYLIDSWEAVKDSPEGKYNQENQDRRYNIVKEKFRNLISNGGVVIMRKISDEAALNFDDFFFDFVYVDGDHGYEQVKKDLNNYYPKVKQGGFFCGDDYNFEGIKQAVDEFANEKNIRLQIKNQQFIFKK